MRTRDKVSIGWCDPGTVDGLFALNLAQLYSQRGDRIDWLLRDEGSAQVAKARNHLVAQFLERGGHWLLMVDSDEVLSVAAFDKLVSVAHDTERPIVSGLVFAAFRGAGPFPVPVPTMYNDAGEGRWQPVNDYPRDSVIGVDSVGTGCLLVHRSVFERMRENASDDEGSQWCWFGAGPVGGNWIGEDFIFCSRARQLGYPIHVHTGAVLPHRKSFWLGQEHHDLALASRPTS